MKDNQLNNLLTTAKNWAEKNNIAWKNSFLCWDLPSNIMADFSLTLALFIAGQTKQEPHVVAQEIMRVNDYPNLEWTITSQGYINFRFSSSYYQQFFQTTYQQEGRNFQGEPKNQRVNLEYVSANPTGYLHLAHFRQAFIGNTLAQIYQFLGYQVSQEYYINDRGEQINSLINSVYYFSITNYKI